MLSCRAGRKAPSRLLERDLSIIPAPVTNTIYMLRVTHVQGRTQAPARLSERDLIALMERHGIGTDATVAEHIQKQVLLAMQTSSCRASCAQHGRHPRLHAMRALVCVQMLYVGQACQHGQITG